jgi:hypothetical protein
MTTMTLRGIDDNLASSLKEMARQEGISLNALALRLMREAAGIDKRKRTAVYHDLDTLAGTWCAEEEAEFSKSTQGFEAVDEDLWR